MLQQSTHMFQYCFNPTATSHPSHGSIMTHNSCFFKEGPVSYSYNLMHMHTIPRMGKGGHSHITQAVQLNTNLHSNQTHMPRPFMMPAEMHKSRSFMPLIHEWQQSNYHPIKLLNTHFQIKDGDY